MKALHNLRLMTATILIALFAGCAGITEANLSKTDAQALDARDVTADSPVQSAEAPGYFHGGDQEDMIDVRPVNEHQNRD